MGWQFAGRAVMHYESIRLKPGTTCRLNEISTLPQHKNWEKESAIQRITENAEVVADLARRLYADDRRAILLILQGMDTSGKDSTIRTIMHGINPQSCQVTSFKVPSEEELDHDFLWRIHRAVPRKGNIGIFNRSHYEDVLVVRVHNIVPTEVWSKRFEQINHFEKLLAETGTIVLKCFLHISKDEQRKRLQDRIDDPQEHWKFNPRDLDERKLWSDYQRAYEDAITHCNTEHAPWHIVPSDKKWCRNVIVSDLLRHTLQALDPQYPPAVQKYQGLKVE
jgi:PPK2 family polyphosphate:nucleotide phosphotransferase